VVGTRDLDQVARWWQLDPEANLGVVVGGRSRLLVLDVDVKHVDGHASLRDWRRAREAEGLTVPPHPSVSSPHGGRHHWFLLPPDVEHLPRNDYFIPGVEVKACGGLVAVPPSVRDVEVTQEDSYTGALYEDVAVVAYTWDTVHVGSIPVAPGWLVEDVTTRREGAAWLRGPSGEFGGSADEQLPPTGEFTQRGFWRAGSRNRDCFRLACRLYTKLGVDAAVLEIIRQVWERTEDKVDFTWQEAEYTARGARDRMRRAVAQERVKLDGYRELSARLRREGRW
jgi:hypothetical protein